MKKRSALTPVLSVVLSLLILAAGLIAGIKGGTFSKDKDETSDKPSGRFEFEGLNDTFAFASASMEKINGIFSGSANVGNFSKLTFTPDQSLLDEMDGSEAAGLKSVSVSSDVKVKGESSAADICLDYDGERLVTLNTVYSDNTAYFRVPELNEAYVKGNVEQLITEEIGNYGEEIEIPEEVQNALNAFDGEKCSRLLNDFLDIVRDGLPEGKNSGETSGKINGISYKYDVVTVEVTEEDVRNISVALIEKFRGDSDVKALYDAFNAAAEERLAENGDVPDEKLPEFDEYCQMLLDLVNEDVSDSSESSQSLKFKLFYDGDRLMGFSTSEDDEDITAVIIDNEEEFAVGISGINSDGEETRLDFSVTGKDGDYEGKLNFVSAEDTDMNFTAGFVSDTEEQNVDSGVYKGTLEVYLTSEGHTLKAVIDSDCDTDSSKAAVSVLFDDKQYFTVEFESVITNASDVTLPTGKVYDISNEADMQEYSEGCDLQGFEQYLKDALGEELYDALTDEFSQPTEYDEPMIDAPAYDLPEPTDEYDYFSF